MATIARLVTVIEAQMEGFEKATTSLEQIGRSADGMVGTVTTLGKALAGAFTVGAVIGYAKEIIAFASEISDLSVRTGIGVERLQALNYVGATVGVTVDQMADAVAQLSKRLVSGEAGAVDAVDRLGLNMKSLLAMSPDEALFNIASAASRIHDPMEKNAVAMELFGKSGSKLLPLLTEELRELVIAAEKTNAVMSKETIAAADAFDDALAKLWIGSKALAGTLAGSVVMGFQNANQSTSVYSEELERNAKATAELTKEQDALAGALNRAHLNSMQLADYDLPKITLSMKEVETISNKLTTSALASIEKGFAAQAAAVTSAEKAYRNYVNFVEERYIETINLQQEAIREQIDSVIMKVTEFNSSIDGMTVVTMQNLDKQTFAWAEWMIAVHDDMAAHEHDMLATNANVNQSWIERGQVFGDFVSDIDNLMGQFDGRSRSALQNIASYWHGMGQATRGVMRVMQGDVRGWADVVLGTINQVMSAISLVKGIIDHFRGGEEGILVNPARDQFIAQYGGFDAMKGQMNMVGMDADLTERLTLALLHSDTMAKFQAAEDSIIALIGGQKFHSGGMVPGTGEVPATLLGGERVQSRADVADMRGMRDDLRAINFNLMRLFDELPRAIQASAHIARGHGASRA